MIEPGAVACYTFYATISKFSVAIHRFNFPSQTWSRGIRGLRPRNTSRKGHELQLMLFSLDLFSDTVRAS